MATQQVSARRKRRVKVGDVVLAGSGLAECRGVVQEIYGSPGLRRAVVRVPILDAFGETLADDDITVHLDEVRLAETD